MSVLLFLIVLYVLLSLSMMKLFEKAGIPGWKALVPGLAAVEWAKMVGHRSPWYALWLLFPIVNFFIYAGLCIDMVRSFGKHSFWQAALSVIYAPIPFFLIGRNPDDKYEGPILHKEREYHRQYHEAQEKKDKATLRKLEANNPFQKSQFREWSEAIIFAVFAAAFIRMFLIEAYVIPTSSMEGTLKVGDYLFVSKAHYGIRTPMTVLQFPLIHNRFSSGDGILARESYFSEPSLPYYRLPALEEIDHNEPVVFNFPAGDSVIITPTRTWDVYQWRREIENLRRANRPTPPMPEIVVRPLDKKDHYIKRCIGLSGDSLKIIDGQVHLNNKAIPNPTNQQFAYYINNNSGSLNLKGLEDIGVSLNDAIALEMPTGEIRRYYNLDVTQVEKVKSWGDGITLERYKPGARPGYVFPNDLTQYTNWTVDDFGPIFIPKKGTSVELTPASLPFYERIIRVYEKNDLVVKNGKYYINGQETTSYTFKQDYFWMMGDNRHNSEDSRIWGYVPEDHIVGKPLFIWFSTKNGNIREGINWDRIFRSASRM